MPPTTVCIVVNYNNAPDTLACLHALARQTTPLTTVVVDNGSTDDSAVQMRAAIQSHPGMHLLPAGRNGGFSAGNNIGIRWALQHAAPTFFWLLNNDTVPPPDTLALLLAEAAADPQTGLVGTVLHYAHAPGTVQAWGGGRIHPTTAFATHFTTPHTFGPGTYLTFASVLLRAEMLHQIGLLDEAFFMYFEDADLCLRAQKAGWRMRVAPTTAVLHREGGSTPTTTGDARIKTGNAPTKTSRALSPSPQKDAITTASALRLIHLHSPTPRRGTALFLLRRLAKRLASGQFPQVRSVLRASKAFLVATKPGK